MKVQRLNHVIASMLGVDISYVVSSSNLVSDLAADSLDLLELIMAIEDDFEIEIPKEVASCFYTVGDIEAYLAKAGKIQKHICDPQKPVFTINQKVLHTKSGNIYTVKGLPANYRIETTNTPAYAYLDEDFQVVWVRSQTEMEDGRFEAYRD